MKEAASEFLANKRIAVTGVSRSAKDHGANTVFKRLRDREYEVFAVNPKCRSGRKGCTGPVTEELARLGRVITYDRRGYARSGGEPVRLISRHTAEPSRFWSTCGRHPRP